MPTAFVNSLSLLIFILGMFFHANFLSAEDSSPPLRTLSIEQNTAQILKLSQQIGQVFVANPDIADVQVNNANSAYIFAKKPGETTIVATDQKGGILANINLSVTHNLGSLSEILKKSIPHHEIRLHSSPFGIIMDGSVSTPKAAKQAESIAKRFLADKEELVNNLTISSPTQVYLKVKIAEVSRSVLSNLGINWDVAVSAAKGRITFGLLQGRSPLLGARGSPLTGNTLSQSTALNQGLPGSLGINFNDDRSNIGSLLDALQAENLATVLAEPNLVALSGETASFLAGGEYPYPVPQKENVTIEFKQVGISLAFTPTVLSAKLINLRVRPEVSALDTDRKITVNNMDIYAIKTRRAETSVELGSGQSLAIAGLFSNEMSNSLKSSSFFDAIPLLSALLRSTQFQRNQTELVIIVTPYIVKPTVESNLSLPTEKLRFALPLEVIMEGRLNRISGSSEASISNTSLQGEAGFYID